MTVLHELVFSFENNIICNVIIVVKNCNTHVASM